MSDETKPTSEWEHSHALNEGDELTDVDEDTPLTVEEVAFNGNVSVKAWHDERHGQEYHTEMFTESEVTTALSDGLWETTDGKSHELATY